jgi:hypothetical protein
MEAELTEDPRPERTRPERTGRREVGTPIPAALIDVLIRGLETAKQRIEDGSTTELFCAFLYWNHEQCGIGYWSAD